MGIYRPSLYTNLLASLKETMLPINKAAFKYESFTLGEKSPKTEFYNNG